MKKTLILLVGLSLLWAAGFAGVVKKTKSEVSFKKIGTFTTLQTAKITADKKSTDSENKFKGRGLAGLAAKAILKSGSTGEIVDLPAKTVYKLNHKKKSYTESPIKKYRDDKKSDAGEGDEEDEGDEAEEGDVKITRNEFKVEDTGEAKEINGFPCSKYTVEWIVEWENEATGATGANRLFTVTWTTPISADLKLAQAEEMKFSRAYMKALGFDLDDMQQQILGKNWMSIFSALGKGGGAPEGDGADFAKEMKKIKGYPVVIDGEYYTKSEGGEEEEGGPKKLFGKLFKKKKSKGDKPAFTYYTELLALENTTLDAGEFQVPDDYTLK